MWRQTTWAILLEQIDSGKATSDRVQCERYLLKGWNQHLRKGREGKKTEVGRGRRRAVKQV